jgi:O-acetylserine/cysteine efflux transporter
MKPKDFALALIVITVWGLNFIFISYGLRTLPPLLFCCFRFALTAFPAVFFLKRPRVPWKLLAGYGVFTFSLQFAFLFTAMQLGMSAGLAALVLQLQAFITIGLAAAFFRDFPKREQLLGAAISLCGIAVVAAHSDVKTTIVGLVLSLLAAASWASGNIFAKKLGSQNPLSLVTWGNLYALVPTLILTLILEGPTLITPALARIDWLTIGSLLYVVIVSSFLGYSLWNYLLNKYAAAVVAPFSLLVPVVSFVSSSYLLGETLPIWKLIAAALVIGGLAFNLTQSRMRTCAERRTS